MQNNNKCPTPYSYPWLYGLSGTFAAGSLAAYLVIQHTSLLDGASSEKIAGYSLLGGVITWGALLYAFASIVSLGMMVYYTAELVLEAKDCIASSCASLSHSCASFFGKLGKTTSLDEVNIQQTSMDPSDLERLIGGDPTQYGTLQH